MSALETKEKILDTTLALIKERNGDTVGVTIRMIADRAGIGVGLTNHYFRSKEILIEECIAPVMETVFDNFKQAPEEDGGRVGSIEATKREARFVMHFMLENEAVARAAIQANVASGNGEDYFSRLTDAFAYSMADKAELEAMLNNDRISEKMKQQFREHCVSEQRRKAFMITSSIREAFIRKDTLPGIIGIDLNDSEQCDEYIDEMVEMLL
ncbi:MAG: TetR/AcrR family transcriptional regulator [Lachnospiraceae bacterium]|nr:TetR/AcrR family transcriptional regulator [Lachnospiraceae bacterium]